MEAGLPAAGRPLKVCRKQLRQLKTGQEELMEEGAGCGQMAPAADSRIIGKTPE